LEKAKADNNTVAADIAQGEIEKLVSTLTSAKGLGGKARDLNNQFEKLRPKILGRLGTVYDSMRKANPPMNRLAEHFEASISCEGVTGFVYRPAGNPPPWQFHHEGPK
jgi:hypothetical protein